MNEVCGLLLQVGKHEDVEGDNTDATDTAKMSLYNLRDVIELPTSAWTGTNLVSGAIASTSNKVKFKVRANCETRTYRCTGEDTDPSTCVYQVHVQEGVEGSPTTANQKGCQWMIPGSTPDLNAADCCRK